MYLILVELKNSYYPYDKITKILGRHSFTRLQTGVYISSGSSIVATRAVMELRSRDWYSEKIKRVSAFYAEECHIP